MASNYGKTAMKSITVNKIRLLATLRTNLEKHKTEYAEARVGYEAARVEALRNLSEAAAKAAEQPTKDNRDAVGDSYLKFSSLDRPTNHEDSYEQAIALMEWEENTTLELSINDFECYVRDNWTWQRQFKMSHSTYSSS